MTQTRTNHKATPIEPGMKIWANVYGFAMDKTPAKVISTRQAGRYLMVTVEGGAEEIPMVSRTPYFLYA